MDESLADQLLGKNIFSTAVLAQKSIEDLIVIRSIDEEFAGRMIEEAKIIPFEAKEDPREDEAETSESESETPDAGADEEDDVPVETAREGEGEGVKEMGTVDNSDE